MKLQTSNTPNIKLARQFLPTGRGQKFLILTLVALLLITIFLWYGLAGLAKHQTALHQTEWAKLAAQAKQPYLRIIADLNHSQKILTAAQQSQNSNNQFSFIPDKALFGAVIEALIAKNQGVEGALYLSRTDILSSIDELSLRTTQKRKFTYRMEYSIWGQSVDPQIISQAYIENHPYIQDSMAAVKQHDQMHVSPPFALPTSKTTDRFWLAHSLPVSQTRIGQDGADNPQDSIGIIILLVNIEKMLALPSLSTTTAHLEAYIGDNRQAAFQFYPPRQSGLWHFFYSFYAQDRKTTLLIAPPPLSIVLRADIIPNVNDKILSLIGIVLLSFALFFYTLWLYLRDHWVGKEKQKLENILKSQNRSLINQDMVFKQLVESTNIVPWFADLNLERFTYIGPQIAVLTGRSEKEWLEDGFLHEHIYHEDRDRMLYALDSVSPMSPSIVEYRIVHKDGSIIWVRNSMTVLENSLYEYPAEQIILKTYPDKQTGKNIVQGFFIDITVQRNLQLSSQKAKEAAENASRLESEFLSAMTHELRTPLNAIIGFSQILRDVNNASSLSEEHRNFLDSIYSSGQHLMKLITDIFEITKLETGKIRLQKDEMDLGQLITSCCQELKDEAAKIKVEIQHVEPKQTYLLNADRQRLRQVFLKLIGNAIKFSQSGKSIVIETELSEKGGIQIHIKDRGVGLKVEQADEILQKFRQADRSLTRQHEGIGLGLPIAKGLIILHGGELVLTPRMDLYGGLIATVILPKELRMINDSSYPIVKKPGKITPKAILQ